MQVTVRLFAAAAAAYGSPVIDLELPPATTVLDLETQLRQGNTRMGLLLDRCSLLRNEVALGPLPTARKVRLGHGDVVDVLPPFAGG